MSQIIIFFFAHVLRHCCRVSIYCWYNYGTKRPHSRYIFLNVLKLLKQNANYKYVAIALCNLYVLHFTVCKDSKHCRLYNASRICITNGIYYEWSQKHCPAYCGYCQGSYSSFKIGTFILRLDSTQRPEKWSSSFLSLISLEIFICVRRRRIMCFYFLRNYVLL